MARAPRKKPAAKAAPKSEATPAKPSAPKADGPALNCHGEPVPQSTISFDTIEKD